MSELAEALRPFKTDFLHYAPRALKIRAKSGAIEPLNLNTAQTLIHSHLERQLAETGRIRAIIIKGRQQGASTYIEARFYWRTSMAFGKQALILTHLQDSTDALFDMTKRYHDLCPTVLQPKTSAASAKELKFSDLDSGYIVATAGSKAVGRGRTIQYFHGCLGLDVDVVTASGSLIKVGDVAVGQDLVTHTGKIAKVSGISDLVKPAFDVRMKGLRGFPLVATDEHRFWTQDGWKELRDIPVGGVIGYPVRTITPEITSLPFRKPDSIRPQGGGSRETGPDRVDLTFDLGRIVGLYLAEGCLIRQAKPPKAASAITFGIHEREAERTIEWLGKCSHLFKSVSHAKSKTSKTNMVTAYGRSFAMFIEELVGSKDGKRFPAEWWKMPRDFVEGICLGYLAGDGHSSKREYDRRISVPSIRSATILGLRDALASLGYGWATVTSREAAVRSGRNEKKQWTLRLSGQGVDDLCKKLGWTMPERRRFGSYGDVKISDGYAWIPVVSKEPVGSVQVRDFEIDDDDHSYCVIHGGSHNSEFAFWANAEDHMAGLGQAVPDLDGTEVIMETTANGVGNLCHKMSMAALKGIGDYRLIFVPWFLQEEYRSTAPSDFVLVGEEKDYAETFKLDNDQMMWRRRKIQDDFRGDVALFDQEYPATVHLAFRRVSGNPLIDPAKVALARLPERCNIDPTGNRIMGVDPAEYGDDATAIVMRQGRKVDTVIRYYKRGPMEVAGLVAVEADRWKPDAINVDCTGVGSGVADRLIELGYPVNRVHFGERAIQNDIYGLRRDEMWGEMKRWLEDQPNSLPDDDSLEADLTAPQYTYDSSRRLKLESKEVMKRRGINSPDSADALALTFAMPFSSTSGKASSFKEQRSTAKRDWRSA
jgi:hypothetical protein